jgi:hypothetical protein
VYLNFIFLNKQTGRQVSEPNSCQQFSNLIPHHKLKATENDLSSESLTSFAGTILNTAVDMPICWCSEQVVRTFDRLDLWTLLRYFSLSNHTKDLEAKDNGLFSFRFYSSSKITGKIMRPMQNKCGSG